MKNFRRLAVVVLTLFVIALSLPTVSVLAADPDMRYGRTKLSTDQQYIYDKLVEGCENATAEIAIDISGKDIDFQNDLGFIYNMFYSDYPEYFWVNGAWSASMTQRGSTVTLYMKPVYTMTGSALSTAKSQYNAKVNELTSGLSGKSDYEKSMIIHDRLIDTVTYTSTNNDQNAYGALVEGKAVCNGYARAYQHLMNTVGVPTWFVRGTSINPTTGTSIGHAWNIVKLDGKWYYTDVTWDDQGKDTFYEYLNITTSKMTEGHELDSEYAALVPQATATDANYFKKENREFSSYDQARLVSLLKKDNNKTQIYISGDMDSFFDSVKSNLLSIAKQLGGTGAFKVSYNADILKNAVILNVVVISENHTHQAKTTVPQVNASCLTNGTKAYYICDCGLNFSDSACTKQIASKSELTIPAFSHTPSGWKNDATNHWKECTNCGIETANTRSYHADSNKDYTCDTCGYALPKADESGNIIVDSGTSGDIDSGTGNNSGNNSSSSNSQTEVPDNSEQSNTTSDESPSTDVSDENPNDENQETISTTDNDESSKNDDGKSNKNITKYIIVGGAATIVIAGIAVTFMLINKKGN